MANFHKKLYMYIFSIGIIFVFSNNCLVVTNVCNSVNFTDICNLKFITRNEFYEIARKIPNINTLVKQNKSDIFESKSHIFESNEILESKKIYSELIKIAENVNQNIINKSGLEYMNNDEITKWAWKTVNKIQNIDNGNPQRLLSENLKSIDYLDKIYNFLEGDYFNCDINGRSVSIGDSIDKVIDIFGQPDRKDLGSYGFLWYVYKNEYRKYFQIGIKNGKVVGAYFYGDGFKIDDKISLGKSQQELKKCYGQSIRRLQKRNCAFVTQEKNSKYDLFLINNCYVTVFYADCLNGGVISVQVISRQAEMDYPGFYGEPSQELQYAMEQTLFDLTNAERVRLGKKPLKFDTKFLDVSRLHSQDMINRDYFSHISPDGNDVLNRILKKDPTFNGGVGEVLVRNKLNAFYAHNGLINSNKHYEVMINNGLEYGCVGVEFLTRFNNEPYFTENLFYNK